MRWREGKSVSHLELEWSAGYALCGEPTDGYADALAEDRRMPATGKPTKQICKNCARRARALAKAVEAA